MRGLRTAGACLLLSMILAAPTAAQDDEAQPWPKRLSGDKGEIIIYQPQVESFAGDKLESRAAVAVKTTDMDEMIFGAMWFESHLATDMETRTATLVRTKVTAATFPDVEQEKVDRLSRYLEQEIPTWDFEVSIDRLLASLPEGERPDESLQGDPPRIYHRTVPAVLVLIDGEPILSGLEGFDLEYVVNSAFFLVKAGNSGYFLRGSGMWFTSGEITGPWRPTDDLPAEVDKVSQKIDEEEAAQAAEQADDAEALGLERAQDEPAPEIIVSTEPAELVVTEGEPDFASVEGTQLLYLKNTESDVLMDIAGQQYYVLVSGRWYRAKSLAADAWEFVPFADLPADFALIPQGSDMATVLASVPGTTESREAVLETQIPQTAEVDRKTATCEVQWDGEPEFEVCGDNDVAYARNTDKPVLLIDERYYCVDEAVWFESGGPEGPWTVATAVPAAVQDLPPECPVYNVKYVYIYDVTPEVVYVGYTPGYYGSYVYGPCVVYGTGWYYQPWWGYYYYPRPVTYGYGVHYSPYGGWGFSFGVSYGWLTIGVGWGRPPYGCWGPAGYRYGYRRGYWHGYNRGYAHGYRRGAAAGYRAGHHAAQRPRHDNAYRNRGDGVKHTGDVRSRDGKRPATSDRKNNVYADRNGDVYRDRDGNWEKREGGDWSDKRDGAERDGDRTREDREGGAENRDRAEQDRAEKDRADRDRADRDRADKDRAERDRSDRESRDRDQSRDRGGSDRADRDRGGSGNQQLDRDRSSRNRGNERQRQSPNRGGGQRRGGGGGRRR